MRSPTNLPSEDKLQLTFFKTFKPPKKLTLSEWADTYAYLSPESSADPGRWKTLPYQKEIMDAISDPRIEHVTVKKSSRVGFTKLLNHVIGFHMHSDPCPIMLVQPSIEDAEGYSREELAPMLRDTPVLYGLVAEPKSKDSNNTLLSKKFPQGVISLVGSNSARGFRRVSRRVVLFDETDGYCVSGAGSEGDQIKLGIRRTEYYWNRKIVTGSTPTLKDVSRIDRLYLQTDQRRYFVPCPQCGEFQYLQFKHLKWPPGEPDKAFFVCEKNGCVIEESSKTSMVEKGVWRPTAIGEDPKHIGFHIWAAYSYAPNATWPQIAKEFLASKNDQESLKAYVNTVLGESFESDYVAKVGAEEIMERTELYEPMCAPKEVLVVTCGVDVQDNRLSVQVHGWAGVNESPEECWVLLNEEIYGDPSGPDIWKTLDTLLLKPLKHERFGEIKILSAAIDSGGHHTHQVYTFTRDRRKRNVIAIKGASIKGKPVISRPTKVDFNYRGMVLKKGASVHMVGTDTAKTTIYARLKNNTPGPGYIHFYSKLPPDYFSQLTCERQMIRYHKGFPIREFIKKKEDRNEALDTFVYSFAALNFIQTRYYRATFWAQMEKSLTGKTNPEDKIEADKNQNLPIKGKQSTLKRGGGPNFITNW